MKIFIDTNNREDIKVEVDYDKTKPVESIVAEYSGALAIAQSQKIEDLIDELGVDEKTKKGLLESTHMSNKFLFDFICKIKVEREDVEEVSNILGLISLLQTLKGDK